MRLSSGHQCCTVARPRTLSHTYTVLGLVIVTIVTKRVKSDLRPSRFVRIAKCFCVFRSVLQTVLPKSDGDSGTAAV